MRYLLDFSLPGVIRLCFISFRLHLSPIPISFHDCFLNSPTSCLLPPSLVSPIPSFYIFPWSPMRLYAESYQRHATSCEGRTREFFIVVGVIVPPQPCSASLLCYPVASQPHCQLPFHFSGSNLRAENRLPSGISLQKMLIHRFVVVLGIIVILFLFLLLYIILMHVL